MEPPKGSDLLHDDTWELKGKNVEKNSGLINTQWSHQKANQD